MLWTPEGNWDSDIVSSTTVKRLGAKVEQSQKGVSSVDFMGKPVETKGYVVLEWGLEQSRQVHRTRFLVAIAEDSSFEVILGRRHAIEYGLVQP
ncbi:hypothetical protein BFW01_g11797 [Lasiodiplodia theobromae]|nr:hypothetical protein BFW01_g11797 [Lasiodiplodia theobromae]